MADVVDDEAPHPPQLRALALLAALPPPPDDDPAHTGVWVRGEREFAGMSRGDVVARLRADPLRPTPWASTQWLADVEAGVGVRDLGYDDVACLGRALVPPRPDWWEGGYEHDLGFARAGHIGPATPGYRRYWARVVTVHEEVARYRRGGRFDPREQLRVLCELLNANDVAYVVIGSGAGVGHGADLATEDTDVVPRTDAENLERLCAAVNVLGRAGTARTARGAGRSTGAGWNLVTWAATRSAWRCRPASGAWT